MLFFVWDPAAAYPPMPVAVAKSKILLIKKKAQKGFRFFLEQVLAPDGRIGKYSF